ncbi:MAG: terminase small subunit [candidate division Zixibacteria bacterium]|nr:terminase small subunit [candidate division Zixibacteria bacterium]
MVEDPTRTDSEAYIAGGGTARNTESIRASSFELLRNPAVRRFIESFNLPAAIINPRIMSRERMLEDLTIIADASIFDICQLIHADDELMNVESGEMFTRMESFTAKRVSDIRPEHRKLIKEMKMGKYGIEVKLIDPMQARKMLAEMQGLNAPIKTESTVVAQVNVSDEELAEKLRLLGLGRNHNQLAGKADGE